MLRKFTRGLFVSLIAAFLTFGGVYACSDEDIKNDTGTDSTVKDTSTDVSGDTVSEDGSDATPDISEDTDTMGS